MPTTIKDAKSGNVAKVDADQALLVRAITQTEEHFTSAKTEESYFANTTNAANTLTTTATGGGVLFLRNNSSTKLMVIEKVLSSADTAGGVVVWKKNVTVGTIGNNNVHIPVNLNFGSTKEADALCYNWDEVGDGMTGITNGEVVKTFITGVGFTIHPIDGTIIMEKNSNILIEYIGAGEFECGIRFYYEVV